MSVVEAVVAMSVFLIGLCALEHYTRNSRLPYVCWVLLAGLVYGFLLRGPLPNLPPLQHLLSPDIVLYVFLPLLIFDSSRKLGIESSKEVALPSFLLATLGLVLNMFVMAGILYGFAKIIGFTIGWIDVLLLCGIMSATDPVAVGSVFKVFPIPLKLRMLIEGESLLNDGTTVIIFMLLRNIVLDGKHFSLLPTVGMFTVSIVAAAAIGIIFGFVGFWLLRRWRALNDNFIAPLLPLLFVYLAFALAQAQFEISGVIAVVAATLTFHVIFNRLDSNEVPPEKEKDRYFSLWGFLNDMANVLLFFVLGVEMGLHTGRIAHFIVLVGILALFVARAVTVYGFGALARSSSMRLPLSWQHVLNIGGLRGALCAALVLMMPHDYQYRGLFLYIALSLSLFTLIVNPLLMRAYLKKADL